MNKIKHIYISYWFSELNYNPSIKVKELEDEVRSVIDNPLMFDENDSLTNIAIPRIQGISKDNKYLFTVSLINSILSIDIKDDIDIDEAILLINSNVQLFYDILKRVFDLKVVYTSIKVELIDEDKKAKKKFVDSFQFNNKKYENLTVKQGIIKDNYYINYVLEYASEYNFNIEHAKDISSDDLFNKTMVTSLSNAELNRNYLTVIVEVNDRYSFNLDSNYESEKDAIRGMILELKDILNKELYWKI